MKLKCRCGYECPVEVPEGSYNVGERKRQTGMFFVFLADGESTWICKTCNDELVRLVKKAYEIVGSDHWSPYAVSCSN